MNRGMTYEDRQSRIAAERATWPEQYATVREAIALGFWPDAYRNTENDASILCPPTKFCYPRAGVSYPLHVDGPAAGASLRFWTHHKGTPDELRHKPVWLAAIEALDHPMQWTRFGPATFDETLAWCVALGDRMQAEFIVPVYDPETRDTSLPLHQWREIAAVPLPSDDPAPAPAQLALFDAPEPQPETTLSRTRRLIREALAGLTVPDDTMLRGSFYAYDVASLVGAANRRRQSAHREISEDEAIA